MESNRELKAETVLYLKMKDGETEEEAMDRMMNMLTDSGLEFLDLEKNYCEVREYDC